jgi:serine/threonine protein kinase
MTLAASVKLGPYEILSPLGAGGMGEVYRARDSRLRREVAIKVLSPEFSSDAGRRSRFEQEAHAASALNHPNIIAIYDPSCATKRSRGLFGISGPGAPESASPSGTSDEGQIAESLLAGI